MESLVQQVWRPALEILILAVSIYYSFRYLRGTRGWPVVIGFVVVVIALTLVTTILDLKVLRLLLGAFSAFFAIAVVVIFQPELRRIFAEVGSRPLLGGYRQQTEVIEMVIRTLEQMQEQE